MARGGCRPGAGRKKGGKNNPKPAKTGETLTKAEKKEAKAQGLTPLEYMLKVMNDEGVEDSRRDRMAAYAAPYIHGRASEKGGKKADREERAKDAAKGFGSLPVPLRAVK